MYSLYFYILFLFYISSVIGATPHCTTGDDGEGNEGCIASPSSPQLIPGFINPCTQVSGTVRKFSTVVWTVTNNYTHCNDTTPRNSVLRVRTQTADNSDNRQPLVFVARGDGNVQTWKLPQYQSIFHEYFHNFTRTVCSTTFRDNNTAEEEVAMYIDVFTSRDEEVEYDIAIETVDDFELKLNQNKQLTVGPNSPQLFYFKFPPDIASVSVMASSSDSNTCAIVSIQNATCPVNDVLDSGCSKGVYQTMTTSASLTINAGVITETDDFFIVVVAADPSLCTGKEANDEKYNYFQIITLQIISSKSASQYPLAIALPVGIFLLVGVVIMMTFIYPCIHCTCRPFVCKNCFESGIIKDEEPSDIPLVVSIVDTGVSSGATPEDEHQHLVMVSNKEEEYFDGRAELESGDKRMLLDKPANTITVSDMLKRPIATLESQYSVYGWNTFTVGIFYGLPAFQLVLSQQMILKSSGNEDSCFYNFKCSHPLGVFSSFNSVWSNIGYIILGVFFIIIVGIRHYRYKHFCHKNNCFQWCSSCCQNTDYINTNNGLPHFFGLYYAMGIALILEGFMSSFYHICPSSNNFQFDTAFMYIIGGLLIIKIFQARHPDVHANAFVAFVSFAVVIFLTLIGIYNDSSLYWGVRVTLFFCVLISVTCFCVSFYFYHDWRLGYCIEWRSTCIKIFKWFQSWCGPCMERKDWKSLKPRHMVRFVKMVVVIIINIAMLLLMIVSNKGVATIVLALFIANFLLFTAIYLFSKFWYREPWTFKPIIYLGILGITWAAAFYFYINNVAQWEETPAVSREFNKDCVALGFYDNHDIWHFLSAVAIFFSFLFVLTLDDGLNSKKRETICVF